MLAVTRVRRVGYWRWMLKFALLVLEGEERGVFLHTFVEMFLKLLYLVLGETNLDIDHVVRWSCTNVGPALWNIMRVFDQVCRVFEIDR